MKSSSSWPGGKVSERACEDMDELGILQRQFEEAAVQFPFLCHDFLWRGRKLSYPLIPFELKGNELSGRLAEKSRCICLAHWPYDLSDDNEHEKRFTYAHFLTIPRNSQEKYRDSMFKFYTFAKQLFPYLKKVEQKLKNDPLYVYWDDNLTYLNDMVWVGGEKEMGYDVKLLLAMHILTESKKACPMSGNESVMIKDGEPYMRTIENVFLGGALFCAKLIDLVPKDSTEAEGNQETVEIPAEIKQERKLARKTKTKEQAWRDEAPEYIPNADAVRIANDKISASGLSKLLRKPGNNIRWMRNKETRRSKVHTQDFKQYIKNLKSVGEFSEAVFKQRERQEEIDRQKRNTGK
ncbi:MAG: hypothetical protein GY845_24090 [Planctomycetes bacterium]|nr:hypothetical protein [Planctomycetota bacterium]